MANQTLEWAGINTFSQYQHAWKREENETTILQSYTFLKTHNESPDKNKKCTLSYEENVEYIEQTRNNVK